MSKRLTEDEVPQFVSERYWYDRCFERVVSNKSIPLEYSSVQTAFETCMARSMQSHEQVMKSFMNTVNGAK